MSSPSSDPRTPRYIGRYAVLWSDGAWEFTQCVRCDKELRSAAARKVGYGPECKKHLPTGLVESVLRQERREYAAQQEQPTRPVNRRTRRETGQRPFKRGRAKKPTAKQVKFLRYLASRANQTFATPTTSWEASQQIMRLQAALGVNKKPQT